MTDQSSPEETSLWQRRLASQANNRAWTLAELASRTAEEEEELLHAAHAAAYFWNLIGHDSQKAHAALLAAHAHATLRMPKSAQRFLNRALAGFAAQALAPWEQVLLSAVRAHVAAVSGQTQEHRTQYRAAMAGLASLADPDDRSILEATLRVLPAPVD